MFRWFIISAICLSIVSAQQIGTIFSGVKDSVSKGVTAVQEPIEKTAGAVPGAQEVGTAFTGVKNSVTKEVAAAKDPFEKTAVYVTFSQCQNVKKIVGVDYEQYIGVEPDMSKLSLVFSTKQFKVAYNLTSLLDISTLKTFDHSKGLIVYLHGFTDDPSKDSYTSINDAFFHKDNFNIFAVDASSLIRWLYLRSSTMVRFIGEALGGALALLIKGGLKPSSIHLIGHSLGSHIAGFTGKRVQALTGKSVGRISGLDPAGPCFADVEPELRLKATDAEYVDVIHTDANVFGLVDQVGHIDYFPNSGSEQPECLLQTCSHSRAWHLYAESVKNVTGFPAVKCADWMAFKKGECDHNDVSYMGYGSKPGPTGQYFLETNGQSPYARGAAGITHINNEGVVRSIRDQIGFWKR